MKYDLSSNFYPLSNFYPQPTTHYPLPEFYPLSTTLYILYALPSTYLGDCPCPIPIPILPCCPMLMPPIPPLTPTPTGGIIKCPGGREPMAGMFTPRRPRPPPPPPRPPPGGRMSEDRGPRLCPPPPPGTPCVYVREGM